MTGMEEGKERKGREAHEIPRRELNAFNFQPANLRIMIIKLYNGFISILLL